jgi:feruloyl esterase
MRSRPDPTAHALRLMGGLAVALLLAAAASGATPAFALRLVAATPAFALRATAPQAVDAAPCGRIASLTLPHVSITAAQLVDRGVPPDVPADSPTMRALPPFCRVAATLTPSRDSDIKIEVWMPASQWNGKYNAVGNGAFSGSMPYAAMSSALTRGYATSGTDTGHTGNTASFAPGHREKVIDFGWRAVHEMTVAAKAIVAAFYDVAPRQAYWTGCSAGGRQGLKEAQRFPADFDGIVAGAPGLDWTGRASQAVRIAKAFEAEDARLSQAQLRRLHRAVLDACDQADGVKDGVVENPLSCKYDPAALQCKEGSGGGECLTAPQVAAARLIYSPIVNGRSRREIAGLFPGSELGWTDRGWSASARATGLDQFRFLVFEDPLWTIAHFAGDADATRAEEVDSGTINALDPNLKPFFERGGKLIQYHGWSDPQISPGNSTQYYERVVAAVGSALAERSYRLFMAPGMAHCGGGEGPNRFDMVAALERWVEQGVAPDRIIAARVAQGRVERTRPLCPYPQVASYLGSASTDDAASFACR